MVPAIIAGSIGGWSPVERLPGSEGAPWGPIGGGNAGSSEKLQAPHSPVDRKSSEDGLKREASTKSEEPSSSSSDKPAEDKKDEKKPSGSDENV